MTRWAKLGCVWGLLISLCITKALAASPPGFRAEPAFADEFDGTALDASRWQYRGLGPRGMAIQTKDAVSVSNGHLVITTYSAVGEDGKEHVYSGMVTTGNLFKMTYGYWEASLRCRYTPGMQPAFWIQSESVGKPVGKPEAAGVELDVFEHVSGKSDPRDFDHALHWDGYGPDHKSFAKFYTKNDLDDGRFHTFGIAWTPEGYTFYVDDKETLKLDSSQVPVSRALQSIMLSTEIYRAVPAGGYGSRESSKATFEVDYVRVYPLQAEPGQK